MNNLIKYLDSLSGKCLKHYTVGIIQNGLG